VTRQLSIVIPAAFAVMCSTGCDSPRPTYRLSGSVKFNDKPVNIGTITFLPDGNRGNLGKVTGTSIKDGRYEIPNNEAVPGVLGGAYVVIVHGYDGRQGGEYDQGNLIFPEYRTAIDLPDGNAQMDFVVPPK
jgi:hypothetical protein